MEFDFYKGKKVLITGHTGFKGSWLCHMLLKAGADITGCSLPAPTEPSLFALSQLDKDIDSRIGDIRDLSGLKKIFDEKKPEIIIHMAAQPIVRESYKDPVGTYETNVMGTVNVLECIRKSDSVVSAVNVTTDKVYRNNEWIWGYRENEPLDGFDPYSNSKSCSELVTATYKRSFLNDKGIPVSTARAGNVIGGGDFAADRIIPDCIRAIEKGESIVIRNPHSIRPYEHVTDPLRGYLMIAAAQAENQDYADSYNIGPDMDGCVTTGELVELFCKEWKNVSGRELKWVDASPKDREHAPHEANFLKLDCSHIRDKIGWKPAMNIRESLKEIAEFTEVYLNKGSISEYFANYK